MERTQKIINFIFWVLFISGALYGTYLLIGGAFPVSLNPGEQVIKFDAAHYGWEALDPINTTMQITHVGENMKVGFGALELTYNIKGRNRQGIRSTSYSFEGLTYFEFYMKAKNPCVWQVQLKRKSDARMFHKTFRVGTNWYKYRFGLMDFKMETAPGIKWQAQDIQPYILFVDTGAGKYQKNTVWIDNIHIVR